MVDRLSSPALASSPPFHADLPRRLDRHDAARHAYEALLAPKPAPAERLWLEGRLAELG